MGAAALSVDSEVAIRLADEGVPLRAIARATNTPSEDLREQLHGAQAEGRLLELPRDDWPSGFPRDQRALQLARLADENRPALNLAIQQLFALTPTESRALVKLLEYERLSRNVLHVAVSRDGDPLSHIEIVDVVICNLRKKLKALKVQITTLWGYGYQLSFDDRRRTMDLILRHVAETPVE